MKTTCINLFGGPGSGKSTLAAGIFSEMKSLGISTELVGEYVKKWAWQGRPVRPIDQIYILGKQAQAEASLYGKVDFIVTDSPILLSGAYAMLQPDGKCDYVSDAALGFVRAHSDEVKHINLFLRRNKPYDTRGRYESESEAQQRDLHIRNYLNTWGIPYSDRFDSASTPQQILNVILAG
jgi:hypothetical protein